MFACHAKVRGEIDGSAIKEHPLLSWTSSTGVLVNRRCVRDPPRSYALANPLKVLDVFPRGSLVLLDQLHECGRLIVGKDDSRIPL